jgi:hypothetical protein
MGIGFQLSTNVSKQQRVDYESRGTGTKESSYSVPLLYLVRAPSVTIALVANLVCNVGLRCGKQV